MTGSCIWVISASFYYIFKAMPFVLDASGHSVASWPSFNTNFKMYWVGRDGFTYCADKNTGAMLGLGIRKDAG